MSQIGSGNLEALLPFASAIAVVSVGANATATSVPIAGLSLSTSDLAGGWALFEAGALGPGTTATLAPIASNTASALSFASGALSAAPQAGYRVWLFQAGQFNVTVSAPENVQQWGGQAVSAASNGIPLMAITTPSSGGVPAGINEATGAALPNYLNGLDTNAFCYQWDAATSNWVPTALNVGAPGSAAPASAVQVAGTDGTDLRALSTDTSGHLNTNVVSALPAGTNTIGAVNAIQSGSWTVADSTLAGASGAPASAAPSQAVQVAGTDGTDLRAIATTSSGQVLVSPVASPPATLVLNEKALATSATTAIMAAAYTVPANGTLNIAVGIESGATATTFLITRNGTQYLAINAGNNLTAGAEYDVSLPVVAGDTVNFETGAATTLAVLEAFFVLGQ